MVLQIFTTILNIFTFLSSIYVTVASVEEWHSGAFLQTLPYNWNVNFDWTLWIVLSYKNVQFSWNLCLDFHHSGVDMLRIVFTLCWSRYWKLHISKLLCFVTGFFFHSSGEYVNRVLLVFIDFNITFSQTNLFFKWKKTKQMWREPG